MAGRATKWSATNASGTAAVLTIDRQHRRNAVDGPTAEALLEGYNRFEADDEARVLVLTGAGDDAFCAGADLKNLAVARRARARRRGAARLHAHDADEAHDRRDQRVLPRRRARARAVVRPADRPPRRAARVPRAPLGRAADRRRHPAAAADRRHGPGAGPDPHRAHHARARGARLGPADRARRRPARSRAADRAGARGVPAADDARRPQRSDRGLRPARSKRGLRSRRGPAPRRWRSPSKARSASRAARAAAAPAPACRRQPRSPRSSRSTMRSNDSSRSSLIPNPPPVSSTANPCSAERTARVAWIASSPVRP